MSDMQADQICWSRLTGVYRDQKLGNFFKSLEDRFNVVDEINFFSRLVNMSLAKQQPFHRWIRYREGYAGDLVKEILRRYPIERDKAFLLDPMCGSGSSLVAAGELGIDALGLDVNAYAVLSSNVKSKSYSKNDLKIIAGYITDFSVAQINKKKVDPLKDIEKYFPQGHLKELTQIQSWINQKIDKQIVLDFFNLALLAILEDCSNRKKDGNGLATRPSPVTDVKVFYIDQLQMMYEDITNPKSYLKSLRVAKDCSALDSKDQVGAFAVATNKSLGTIIFSPPYANSFDYFESYKLELSFGEFVEYKDLKTAKKRLIRNYRIQSAKDQSSKIECVEKLCCEIELSIPDKEKQTGTRDGRTRLVPHMLRAYFEDMDKVIDSSYAQLSSGGTMHIVVDQSSYVGIPIPTDLIFGYLAEKKGFKVISVINCRRANTSGQQLKRFPYLKELLRESIVSLRK